MELSNSDSDLDDLAFMSSPTQLKATPVSSTASGMGNSKVDRALLLERAYRQIDNAELDHVHKLIELPGCMADSCRKQERTGGGEEKVTSEDWRQERKGDIRGVVTPEALHQKSAGTRSSSRGKCWHECFAKEGQAVSEALSQHQKPSDIGRPLTPRKCCL